MIQQRQWFLTASFQNYSPHIVYPKSLINFSLDIGLSISEKAHNHFMLPPGALYS